MTGRRPGGADLAASDDQTHGRPGTNRGDAGARGPAPLEQERARTASEHPQRRTREARRSAPTGGVRRVADAALASLSEENLLRELLLRISQILDTDTAAILLLDDTGTMLHARAAKGIEEEVEQGVKTPVGKGFAGRVAAERRAVFIEDVDHADVLNPILREKGIRSLLGVPLLVEGRVLGVLHVGSLTRHVFTTDERDLLQLAADRAALSPSSTPSSRASASWRRSLQRRLLPTDLRGTAGLELASRYIPASHGSLGGDWYDAFPLADGRVRVTVRDRGSWRPPRGTHRGRGVGMMQALRDLLTNRSTTLIVDVTRTTYLDSAGINLLFELASALEHRQQCLRVVVPPSSHAARMLGIAGLPTVAPPHATLDAALAV